MATDKKRFKDKFQLEGNEWKPKPGGGWQTRGGVLLPPQMEPWLANLRMWVSEMNQWAEVVQEELHELRDEVESLKGKIPSQPGRQPAPSAR
jgi:hypothetical protein